MRKQKAIQNKDKGEEDKRMLITTGAVGDQINRRHKMEIQKQMQERNFREFQKLIQKMKLAGKIKDYQTINKTYC